MIFLLKIISLFWLIRTTKAVLFWIYLWQLKEYHIGRFLDHFRTNKGKRIFFNFLFASKLLLFALFWAIPTIASYILLAVYILESALIVVRRLKKPVFTLKTILLTLVLFFIIAGYLLSISQYVMDFYMVYYLLIFDILVPIIASLVILLIQPIFVYFRINILKKATEKMDGFKNLTVIGVTGSYGKTSTKEFLTTILFSKFKVLSTKDHKNSEIGIAETILKELNKEHQIFIVEMGAYNKGGINLLCDITKPSIGIVTGVNEQHLSTFGSMENLLSAEGGVELLSSLPKDGLLVVNGDNKYCMNLYRNGFGHLYNSFARSEDKNKILSSSLPRNYKNLEKTLRKKIYSLKNDKVDSDIWAEEISVLERSLDFMTMNKEKEAMHFNVKVLGKQNIQNLLGAILVARELGMSLEEISLAVKNIKPEQAGITLKIGVHSINIIDSSYSSNPDGVMADLDYLNIFNGKKVVVMPCLIELGKKSSEVHQQIGKKIAEVCDMAIITTKDKFEEIKNSAMQNGLAGDKIILCERPKEIFHLITASCKAGDAVLLEGGRPKELIKLLGK